MHRLDDAAFVTAHDPKGMYALTVDYPNQCRRALAIAQEAAVLLPACSKIVLAGLGGSAAGGDIAKCLVDAEGTVPFAVVRDYNLPGYVDRDTLVICSSYSGNTEETLSAYADALRRGAKIVALTSGGKLAEQARADGFPVIQIPGGQPPRTALGYMLVPLIHLLVSGGILPDPQFDVVFASLDQEAKTSGVEIGFEGNPAKELAEALFGRVGVLYGVGQGPAAVANRWKGQINENAKNMAFSAAYPELNHNEILGWVETAGQNVRWLLVNLFVGDPSDKMSTRAFETRSLIGDRAEFREVHIFGRNLCAQLMSLTYMGDFVSLYLAALNEVDPENIDWINELKSALARVG